MCKCTHHRQSFFVVQITASTQRTAPRQGEKEKATCLPGSTSTLQQLVRLDYTKGRRDLSPLSLHCSQQSLSTPEIITGGIGLFSSYYLTRYILRPAYLAPHPPTYLAGLIRQKRTRRRKETNLAKDKVYSTPTKG